MSRPESYGGVASVDEPNLANRHSRHGFKRAWSACFDAILIDHDVGGAGWGSGRTTTRAQHRRAQQSYGLERVLGGRCCEFFTQDEGCSTARGGIIDARGDYRARLRLTPSTRDYQNRKYGDEHSYLIHAETPVKR